MTIQYGAEKMGSACPITKARIQTLKHKMLKKNIYYFMLFHYKNGCANAA